MGNWQEWVPFADLKGFVRFALGVIIILMVIRFLPAPIRRAVS